MPSGGKKGVKKNPTETRGWSTCKELSSTRGDLETMVDQLSNNLARHMDTNHARGYDKARVVILEAVRKTLCAASITGVEEGLETTDRLEYLQRKKMAAPPPAIRVKERPVQPREGQARTP